MEHEVFVPVPAESLRGALASPELVARAVPGFQRDTSAADAVGASGAASAAPATWGRLRLRAGGHTITYRGGFRTAETPDGTAFTVEGEGVEARGTGTVKFALTVRVAAAGGGSAVTFSGTAGGDGRIGELPADILRAAAHRLLNRFAENLGTGAGPGDDPQDGDSGDSDSQDGVSEGGEPRAAGDAGAPQEDDGPAESTEHTEHTGTAETTREGAQAADGAPSDDAPSDAVLEAYTGLDPDVPLSSLDPLADTDEASEIPGTPDPAAGRREPARGPGADEARAEESGTGLPVEAAHARRTMIGRSAEEVDHAPPRGRYAPVPAPDSTSAGATLRWAAPAAALALASAVVVGRALRRRR